MRSVLLLLFGVILVLMVAVTTWASLERSVFQAGNLLADRWFVATLCDAYCGFITFYVWVAYRETGWTARIVWFIAIMALGNIAMAVYMLWQLRRLAPGDLWNRLLLRESHSGFRFQSGEVKP